MSRRIILLHIIWFGIDNNKQAKIFFKRRREQLVEMLILGGKTMACEKTPHPPSLTKNRSILRVGGGSVHRLAKLLLFVATFTNQQ